MISRLGPSGKRERAEGETVRDLSLPAATRATLGLGRRGRGRRSIGFSALYGFSSIHFALVLFAAVASYVDPLVMRVSFIYSVVHSLPGRKLTRLEGAAIVNLIDHATPLQLKKLMFAGESGWVISRAPAGDRSVLIGPGCPVAAGRHCGSQQNEKGCSRYRRRMHRTHKPHSSKLNSKKLGLSTQYSPESDP